MASWAVISDKTGPFATRVRERFDTGKHKILGTLRRDGSPRVSGIEVSFVDGELYFGGMYRSVKCLDLQRDPRFALHSPSADPAEADPSDWGGDAKVAGRAVELSDPDEIAAILSGSGGEA